MLDLTDWLMDRPLSVYGTLIATYCGLAWSLLHDLWEID